MGTFAALAPFRTRGFKFQWPADLLTAWALEMETLILGWYVLVETGSVFLLTVFGSLQLLGTLISPMLGVIGDRFGQRNLLAGMRAVYLLLALILMGLAMTDNLTPLRVLIVTGFAGLVRPSDIGMRSALVAERVPAADLVAAMGISRTTSDSARIAGSLAGVGMLAMFGMGPAYAIISTFYFLGLILTLCIGRRPAAAGQASGVTGGSANVGEAAAHPPRKSPWRELREGLAYVWTTPRLLAAMWLAFLVNMTAFPLSGQLLPYVAKEVYHVDKSGLGLLAASFAFGAMLGSIAVSLAGRSIRPARMMILAAVIWYGVLIAYAQAETAALGMAALMAAGFAQSFSMVPLAVMLMRTSDQQFRGRVMGARMLAIYSLPFGLLAAGALIDKVGFAMTATLYAVAGLMLVGVIGLVWRRDIWPAEAPGNVR